MGLLTQESQSGSGNARAFVSEAQTPRARRLGDRVRAEVLCVIHVPSSRERMRTEGFNR